MIDPYRFAVQWYQRAWEDDERTPLHGTYGVFLRGLTIACDHLASAGKRRYVMDFETWLRAWGFRCCAHSSGPWQR